MHIQDLQLYTCNNFIIICLIIQIKLPSLNEKRETDGLFVMIDGGKSSDASARIKKKMAAIVHSELLACEERRDKDKPLLYLEHSFLTMHRYCTVLSIIISRILF